MVARDFLMKRLNLLPLAFAVLLTSCMSVGTEQPRIRDTVKYSTIAKTTLEGQQSVKGRLLLKPPTENGYI